MKLGYLETGADRSAWRKAGEPSVPTERQHFSPERADAAPRRGVGGRLLDRLIADSSLISNDPLLDVRCFPWTQALRDAWRAIREEARGTVRADDAQRCPATAGALAAIPDLHSARFVALAPGAHLACRRGRTKALVTCHLGLAVPRDGDVRMRIGDRMVRWAEGETLVFDDSWPHEAWNDACAPRIVLQLRFRRPLRQPGRWVADKLLGQNVQLNTRTERATSAPF